MRGKNFVTLIEISIELDLDYVFFGSGNSKIVNFMEKYYRFEILDPSTIETRWSGNGSGREGTIPRILYLKKL